MINNYKTLDLSERKKNYKTLGQFSSKKKIKKKNRAMATWQVRV
jgi:hypothetical protein